MASPLNMAIEALSATMQEAIDNSKIMKTLDEQISNALGLLVDLILLPFLPLLVGGIITLYMEIIKFGNIWETAWKNFEKEGIAGLLKLAIEGTATWAYDWLETLMQFLFGSDTEKDAAKKKIIDAVVSFATDVANIGFLPVSYLLGILGVLLGKESVKAIEAVIKSGLEFGSKLVESTLNFIFGNGGLVESAIKLAIDVSQGALGIAWTILEWVYKLITEGTGVVVDVTVNVMKGAIDGVIDFLFGDEKTVDKKVNATVKEEENSWIPKPLQDLFGFRASGGPVSSGTPYIVGEEGPEMFVPSENGSILPNGSTLSNKYFESTTKSQSSTVNLYFYGLTNDELVDKIRGVLREDGARYNL